MKAPRTCSASKPKDFTNIFFMTEELDNTPSPAGDIPQETLPKPLPAPEEYRRGTAGCRSGGK